MFGVSCCANNLPQKLFRFVFFVKFWRLFAKRRFEYLKNDSQRRDDRFCQKIIEIEAILAIFWPFEVLGLDPAPRASIQGRGPRSSAEGLDPATWASIRRRGPRSSVVGFPYGIYGTPLNRLTLNSGSHCTNCDSETMDPGSHCSNCDSETLNSATSDAFYHLRV